MTKEITSSFITVPSSFAFGNSHDLRNCQTPNDTWCAQLLFPNCHTPMNIHELYCVVIGRQRTVRYPSIHAVDRLLTSYQLSVYWHTVCQYTDTWFLLLINIHDVNRCRHYQPWHKYAATLMKVWFFQFASHIQLLICKKLKHVLYRNTFLILVMQVYNIPQFKF